MKLAGSAFGIAVVVEARSFAAVVGCHSESIPSSQMTLLKQKRHRVPSESCWVAARIGQGHSSIHSTNFDYRQKWVG